eukprot:m.19235 g.19235  ORF g.19235 m.19235 type:complete len:147 (+) comp27811_c0_seq8:89-529(+)
MAFPLRQDTTDKGQLLGEADECFITIAAGIAAKHGILTLSEYQLPSSDEESAELRKTLGVKLLQSVHEAKTAFFVELRAVSALLFPQKESGCLSELCQSSLKVFFRFLSLSDGDFAAFGDFPSGESRFGSGEGLLCCYGTFTYRIV